MLQINYLNLLPEIVIAVTSILIIIFDLIKKSEDRNYINEIVSLGGLFLALFLTFNQLQNAEQANNQSMLIADNYSIFFKMVFIFLSVLVILISSQYIVNQNIYYRSEYCSLILTATLGMIIMVDSLNLITVYIGLELMAISIYILVGILREETLSNEAAIKYFLLGLFATCFLLYGISFAYGFFGTTNLISIKEFLIGNISDNTGFTLVLVFLIIAFGFKIAAVPFHMWAPDVYEGSLTSVTAFLSIGPKIAAFAVIGRVFIGTFILLKVQWIVIFYILSVATMFLGNLAALVQTNIKRMLAYSGIAHVGYCLIGIVISGSQPGNIGLQSVIFYLCGYLFMNLGAFAIIIFLNKKGVLGAELDDFSGLNERSPVMALFMAIFMFSLAGIPPTVGFVGKFYIFMSAVKAGYIWLAIFGVLNSVISLYYYLQVVIYMYMKPYTQEKEFSNSKALFLVIGVAVFVVFALGIHPQAVMDLVLNAIKGL